MKKTAFTLATVLTLALWGCADKTVTDSPVPEQPTESAEPVFAEYTEEDFTPIKMNLNITDDAPPFEVHSADLSGLDFGERISPCKAEGVREEYDYINYVFDDPEEQAEYEAEKEQFYNTPSKGIIGSTVFLDGKFYFLVNFDDLCGQHDSSVFSFDPQTGELNEIAARTGLEYDGFRNFITAGGRLIFMENGDKSFTVCNMDPVSGEISELFTAEEEALMMESTDGGVFVSSVEISEDGATTSMAVKKYDIETGEILETFDNNDMSTLFGVPTCGGHPASVTGGRGGEPLSVKTEFYSLETGQKECIGLYLWENKVSVMTDESVNGSARECRLYTYDFARMERTELNFNGFSSANIMAGNGIVNTVNTGDFMGSTSATYYILPELGTAFRLVRADQIIGMESDGVCYILASKRRVSDPNYNPEKVYWFEV